MCPKNELIVEFSYKEMCNKFKTPIVLTKLNNLKEIIYFLNPDPNQ